MKTNYNKYEDRAIPSADPLGGGLTTPSADPLGGGLTTQRKRVVSARNRMKRKRRREKRLYQGIAIVLILLCCCGILFHKTVSSATSSNQPLCYKSIEIQKGDSLWSIAQTYCGSQWNSIEDYINEVKEFNGLYTDELTAGHYIAVPYYPSF